MNVAAVQGHLFHQGGGDEGVLFRRGEEDALQGRHQATVHVGELEFVLEVGDGAQAPDQHVGLLLPGKIHQQAGEAHHLDVGQVSRHLPGQLDTLRQIEQRPFARAVGHPDHHLVKQPGGPAYEVGVAVGDGVEGAGVDYLVGHAADS